MEGFTINAAYAEKYEKRKKAEELSNLKEKYAHAIDSEQENSDDEEEDEVGELVTPEIDLQIFKTVASLKSKDPKVYDSKINFFDGNQCDLILNR